MVHKEVGPCCVKLYLNSIIEACARYSCIPTAWIKGEVYLFTNGLRIQDMICGHQPIATDILKKVFKCNTLCTSKSDIIYLFDINQYTY